MKVIQLVRDLFKVAPKDVELSDERDKAFCQIAQGAVVSNTTFPSGFKSPKETSRHEWVIEGCRLKARLKG